MNTLRCFAGRLERGRNVAAVIALCSGLESHRKYLGEKQSICWRSFSTSNIVRLVLSREHESLRVLFQNHPELAPALLRQALGVDIPNYSSIRIESADFTDIVPAEYRADLVVLLVDDKPVLAIVVEVQLAQDDRKLFTWPVYAVGLRARFECPASVLVVTSDPAVARWASRPIALGPGASMSLWVVGPDKVPLVIDPAMAAIDPELGVLSVMAHGHNDVETAVKVALAAMSGIRHLSDRDQYVLYSDLILAALSDAARKALQMIPEGYQYQSPLIRESIEKGRALGQALSVIEVFEAREIPVSDEQRSRILGCSDLEMLSHWLKQAVTVASVDELFAQ